MNWLADVPRVLSSAVELYNKKKNKNKNNNGNIIIDLTTISPAVNQHMHNLISLQKC